MSIFGRFAELFQAKTNKLLDALEDPNETLDLSYEKMLTGLQQTKSHLADVIAERLSLGKQVQAAQFDVSRSEDGARLALQNGREDLARAALQQKQGAISKLESLQHAQDSIKTQEDRLVEYQKKLETRIEQFRTQKEVVKAQYEASKAQVKVNESLTGIGNQLGNVGASLQRAQDKAGKMQARAEALDHMVEAGILKDPLDPRSSVDRELEALRSNSSIDQELERLKRELPAPEQPKPLSYDPKS